MANTSTTPSDVNPSQENKQPTIDPADDGRNIEWEDRARVNLEQVPEGTRTNIERDFEPESIPTAKDEKKNDPAY